MPQASTQGWTNVVPADAWPWLLIAAGAVGLGVIILLIKLIMRRDSRIAAAAQAKHITPAQQRTLERDVSNLIAALSEMAQSVGTELDQRSARLEQLLAAADERIRQLEQLSTSVDRPIIEAPTAPVVSDPRHAEIYKLADQGLPIIDIAKHLSRPKGEVELILALRPRRAG
jgi:hypothetical protein